MSREVTQDTSGVRVNPDKLVKTVYGKDHWLTAGLDKGVFTKIDGLAFIDGPRMYDM